MCWYTPVSSKLSLGTDRRMLGPWRPASLAESASSIFSEGSRVKRWCGKIIKRAPDIDLWLPNIYTDAFVHFHTYTSTHTNLHSWSDQHEFFPWYHQSPSEGYSRVISWASCCGKQVALQGVIRLSLRATCWHQLEHIMCMTPWLKIKEKPQKQSLTNWMANVWSFSYYCISLDITNNMARTQMWSH